jgi:hypothetical protein
MNTELSKFAPQDFTELLKFAEIAANTNLVPKDFKNKPHDILIACQMGAELGLAPMQSIQNIAVVNGRPSLWGDAVIAIISAHPDCEDITEEFNDSTMTATCTVKRKGRSKVIRSFSQNDAQKAGLWGKGGTWQTYPKRMLQMRARGFACRDSFADALRGLITVEEAQDYPEEKANKIQPEETDIESFKVEFENLMELSGVSEEKVIKKANTASAIEITSLDQIYADQELFTRCLNYLDKVAELKALEKEAKEQEEEVSVLDSEVMYNDK